MGGASVDPLIQARAAGLAHRLLAACVLVLAFIGAGLMADGLSVGSYRLAPLSAWHGAWLMVGGLVAAVIAAEVVRATAALILNRRAG